MQFKHPEVLYFLALLIIPILVHLFHLQRYKKVAFTNVAFLQKINIENRKSSRIKKWLILATRLALFTAIIVAFAQPYLGKEISNEKQNVTIYLDNSLSANTKGKKGNLLQIASQELIETIDKGTNYSLITNTNSHLNVTAPELKDLLLKVENTAKKTNLKEVLLKIESQNKNLRGISSKNILISDFQNVENITFTNTNTNYDLVQQLPEQKNNLSIDSVYIHTTTSNNFNINVVIKNQGNEVKNIPLAIFNDQQLISKQTFNIDKNKTKNLSFSIEKSDSFSGKLQLTLNDTYSFDNQFYFTINTNQKTNVLAIGDNNDFLSRIYNENEFDFANSTLKNVNYNALEKRQLIILNELKEIPSSLITSLTGFSKKGGQLIIIPNIDTNISSYNLLLKNLAVGSINAITKDTLKITNINFKHPMFKNVFDKKITNFQYPQSQTHFSSSFSNASNLISFENNEGFIKQVNAVNSKIFWVASALNKTNSNFTNSPLIVPVFYNIGQQSLQLAKLNYTIDETNAIEIKAILGKDAVVKLQNKNNSFIPLQQNTQNKIKITTKEQPLKNGFYHILHKKDTLNTVAFNYPKEESLLQFLEVKELADTHENLQFSTSVKNTLQKVNKKNKVQWLWKLFLILAIVSLLLEILILKYFKV